MFIQTRAAKRIKQLRHALPKLPTNVIVGCIAPFLHRMEWNLLATSSSEFYREMMIHASLYSPLPSWPRNVTLNMGTVIQDVAFSSNGEWLACGGSDGSVRFYHCVRGHHATAFHSLTIKGASSRKKRTTSSLSVHKVQFSPKDSYTMVSTAHDGSVRLWDLHSNPPTSKLFGEVVVAGGETVGSVHHFATACRVAFSSDGTILACAYSMTHRDSRTACHHNISTWSVPDGICLRRWNSKERIHLLSYLSLPTSSSSSVSHNNHGDDKEPSNNNDERYLLAVHSLRNCRLWDLGWTATTTRCRRHLRRQARGRTSPSERTVPLQRLAMEDDEDEAMDNPDHTLSPTNEELYCAVSPWTTPATASVASAFQSTTTSTKRFLAIAKGNREIGIWSLPDGTLVESMEWNHDLSTLAFGPINKNGTLLLAVGGDSESVCTWRILQENRSGGAKDNAPPVTFLYPTTGFEWCAATLCCTPNGRTLAMGDADKLKFLAM
jgi:WD40 repeat protein